MVVTYRTLLLYLATRFTIKGLDNEMTITVHHFDFLISQKFCVVVFEQKSFMYTVS